MKKINKNKEIFIKNKKRALRDALGKEVWIPEHERLNMTPIESNDVRKDFMNERKKRAPVIGSRKPPASPKRTKMVVPINPEQSWLPPPSSFPSQAQPKQHINGDVDYDDIPDPPQDKYEQHQPLGTDMSGVSAGQYCLIVGNEMWTSDHLHEIEEAIESAMRANSGISEEDFIVMRRLPIKVGVTVGD